MSLAHARPAAASLLLAGAVLALTACGSTSTGTAPSWHPLKVKLPPTVAGFTVQPETASASDLKRATGPHSLIDSAAVFSLRQADVLYGVLELAELTPSAPADDSAFQRDIAGQLGQRIPHAVQVGNRTVYEGAGSSEQLIYTWFDSRRMAILLVHAVRNPDVLLRAVLRLRL